MERIVAMVEGHLETHFIKSTYANAIVQRPFPNGRCVDLDMIVEAIIDQLDTVGGAISRVIVLLDREGRDISSEEMAKYIGEKLNELTENRRLYIGVSDRKIENWIVADEETMREVYEKPSYKYQGDGCNGRAVLEKLNGGVDLGFRDKAQMLKRCSAKRGALTSQSLGRFQSTIDFQWHWALS